MLNRAVAFVGTAILSATQLICARASANEVLFEQPKHLVLASVFHVPQLEHRYPIERDFNLLSWQPNPSRSDGQFVPSHAVVTGKTGLPFAQEPSGGELATSDASDASTVQVAEESIGVYMNSKSLGGKCERPVMITPAFKVPKAKATVPFASAKSSLVHSLDLQVPVATSTNRAGNFAYVVSAMEFDDRTTAAKITYEIVLFHHDPAARGLPTPERLRQIEIGQYDPHTQTYQLQNPIVRGSRLMMLAADSSEFQTHPWRGWKRFQVIISRENFVAALRSLKEKEPSFVGSLAAEDYALDEWHLNAELTCASGPAELGWSMRGARLEVRDTDSHHASLFRARTNSSRSGVSTTS